MTRELVWLLRHRGGRGPDGSLELGPGALLTIGRGSESQLILDDPEISRLHAKLEMRTEGVWIQDLGSNNGTYIDEQRVTSRLWQPGQVLRLGSVKFELDGKPAEKRLAVQADRTHPGRAYLLTWESKKTQTKRSKSTDPASRTTILTIGRNGKCDIVLDDRAVSKSHARVELRGDGIEVRDLDSANGTFIEGTRITASQWRPGETLKIGSFAFSVEPDPADRVPKAVASQPRMAPQAQIPADSKATPASSLRIGWRMKTPSKTSRDHAVTLPVGKSLTVGRDSSCDVVLDDREVSRMHVRIETRPDGARVLDMNTENGTRIDGRRIADELWKIGQRLEIGGYIFALDVGSDTSTYDQALSDIYLRKSKRHRPVSDLVERLRIFISYSRHDLDFADQMAAALENKEFEVIIDRRDLPYGEEWRRELADFIRNSDTVLFLISPQAIASQSCRWELGQVKELRKRLFPIAIGKVAIADLPEELSRVHILPQDGLFDFDRHLPQLVRALNTDRAWVKEHSRLADWAREWRARGKPSAMLLRGPALEIAMVWKLQQPRAEKAAEVVLELIEASRRARIRRRGNWSAGGVGLFAGGMVAGWMYLGLQDAFWEVTNRVVGGLRGSVSALEKQLAVAEQQARKEREARQSAEQRVKQLESERGDAGRSIDNLRGRLEAARRSGDEEAERRLIQELRKVEEQLRAVEEASRRLARVLSADKTFKGHDGPIYDVAIDPGGQIMVTGSRDNTAAIWELATGKKLAVLKPHHGDVLSVAIAPDGKHVVTGSEDKRARLWTMPDGRQVAILAEHTSDVTSVAVTPDSRKIVTASLDKTILIWDLATRKRIGKIEGHEGPVTCVTVAPDGQYIVSGSADKTVRIWDANSGQEIAKLDGRSGPREEEMRGDIVDVAVFRYAGRQYLVSAAADSIARIWDFDAILAQPRTPPPPVRVLNALERGIASLAVTPDGTRVIVGLGGKDNGAWVWDFARDIIVSRLEGHEDRVLTVAVFPDGGRILTGSADKSWKTWIASPDN